MKPKIRSIKRMGAQGDVVFRRVDKVPAGFVPQPSGQVVVAHSETGHNHSIDVAGVRHFVGQDPMICYLQLETVERADVVHHRAWDTHATLRLLGGSGAIWEVRRQREATPDGWKRVED